MFELIGMILTWLIGLAASALVPLLIFARPGKGRDGLTIGLILGVVCAALYVLGTIFIAVAT